MKYIKILCVLAVIFTATSCKKWLDVNTDPATPQSSKAEFYLAPILAKMAYNSAIDYRDVQSKLTQNFGNQTNLDIWERHGWTSSDVGGAMWRHVYINAGLNLEDMISKAESENANTIAGIGYAVKAWGFQLLTDTHGPIILDEAYKDQLTFKYQDQPEVYAQVREWCKLALKRLNTPDTGDYSGILNRNDFMFQGDRVKWRKFVYAILALQYSHLINKPEFKTKYADSVVKYVNLSFQRNEDAMMSFVGNVAYVLDGTPGDASPMSVASNLFAGTGSSRIGQPIVNYLTGGVRGTPTTNPKTSTDPRLTRMITPMTTTVTATNGVYRGVIATKGDIPTVKTIPSVLGATTPTASVPFPGKYIYGTAAPSTSKYPFFTNSQLKFALAEAMFIKDRKDTALIVYKSAIESHMEFVNQYGRNGVPAAAVITSAEISAYLGSSEVAQNSTALTMADIMGQKYIAQWGWAGHEQWSDMRKYHYDFNIFRQVKPLETSEFFRTNSYVYRVRPRYASEYIWNKAELAVWGGLDNDYAYKETWFTLPN